jgi:hypothetical protein
MRRSGPNGTNASDFDEIDSTEEFYSALSKIIHYTSRDNLIEIIQFFLSRSDDALDLLNDFITSEDPIDEFSKPEEMLAYLRRKYELDYDELIRMVSMLTTKLDEPNLLPHKWFEKMSMDLRKAIVKGWQDYSAGFSNGHTKSLMHLKDAKVLPRTTWVSHFSHHAVAVANNGFSIGMPDKHRLALTTKIDQSQKPGGYNFGFISDGETALEYTNEKNSHYGSDFVMFQSAGSLFHHKNDVEDQFVFDGANIDKKLLALVKFDFHEPNRKKVYKVYNYDDGRVIYAGDYVAVVRWIKHNFQEYQNKICPAANAVKKQRESGGKPVDPQT